jgi:hypothetical protein
MTFLVELVTCPDIHTEIINPVRRPEKKTCFFIEKDLRDILDVQMITLMINSLINRDSGGFTKIGELKIENSLLTCNGRRIIISIRFCS